MSAVGRKRPAIGALIDPPDRVIAELANRQHGVVAYRQLIRLGLRRRAIQHRVQSGRLHRIHKGVYAVGHRVLTPMGWRMAAVLACGPDALLSHASAAQLWDLIRRYSARVHVTVPSRGGRAQPGLVVHRVRSLDPRDCAVRNGIPVASVARTLLDLAAVVDASRLTRAIEAAEREGHFDLTAVNELLARSRGRRGARQLRSILSAAVIEPASRSDL